MRSDGVHTHPRMEPHLLGAQNKSAMRCAGDLTLDLGVIEDRLRNPLFSSLVSPRRQPPPRRKDCAPEVPERGQKVRYARWEMLCWH